MPRAARGAASHQRHKRVMDAARGYRGSRNRLYRTAVEAVHRAGKYSYRDRRQRRREFRRLWIVRVNAAARAEGLSYSRLMAGLRRAGVLLDRKMLAEMAVHDQEGFRRLAQVARSA